MPHDLKGQLVEVGDRVRIPVHPQRMVVVAPNEAAAGEAPTWLQVIDEGTVEYLDAEVVEVYPQEDACNPSYRIPGISHDQTFNTRFVEVVEKAPQAEAEG